MISPSPTTSNAMTASNNQANSLFLVSRAVARKGQASKGQPHNTTALLDLRVRPGFSTPWSGLGNAGWNVPGCHSSFGALLRSAHNSCDESTWTIRLGHLPGNIQTSLCFCQRVGHCQPTT